MVGGVSVAALADQYGTPLLLFDEAGLRDNLRRLIDGLRRRWPRSEVLFAAKALPIVAMCALAAEEGAGFDIAGGGELAVALAAGVDPARIFLHGNAKTDDELEMALAASVGTIVVDNEDEIDRLERLVRAPVDVLLRVIPDVDADTHPAQATGGALSKFGLPRRQAGRAMDRLGAHPLITVRGVHVHIGSQVLDTAAFAQAVRRAGASGDFDTYDLGGGLGVRYTYQQQAPTIEGYLDAITEAARQALPSGSRLIIEPGRSVVARPGISVYRVVSVKHTGRTFVAVDGGMADQLDLALSGDRHEAFLARDPDGAPVQEVALVGRQCESGDLLVDGAPLPQAAVGDLVVLTVAGAYSYTFANNYNGALHPAVVFVRDGRHRLVARRETYEDLVRLHSPA